MAAIGGKVEGARVLDLFAGSGALGLEALSRGAAEVVFVERARGALAVLRANMEILGTGRECRVVAGDAMTYVKHLSPTEFDLALADPPYDLGLAKALLELFAEKGFARELWVEHRSKEVMPPLTGLQQRRYGDTTITLAKRDE